MKPLSGMACSVTAKWNFWYKLGKRERASKIAGRLVSLMDKVDASVNVDVSDDFIPEMRRKYLLWLLNRRTRHQLNSGETGFVFVMANRMLLGKYKYVEEDLLGGLCDLVAD